MADIDNTSVNNIECGVIGSGSMGGGMTKLFSENGGVVGFFDVDKKAVENLLQGCKDDPKVPNESVHGYTTADGLLQSFKAGAPRLLVFSLPHGDPVDTVIKDITQYLQKGDIIVDCGNEWWGNTVRRQAEMAKIGVSWIGCGVSGGYQAARRGPSMSAGGDKEAFEKVRHLLELWAARGPDGVTCLGLMGPGGAGHYVKMVHNGIEHAQMGILAELYGLLHHQAGLSNFEIADIMEKWDSAGWLSDNFLVGLGAICLRTTDGDGMGHVPEGIVEAIDDKIVQDVDNSEGTGTWTNSETAIRHVSAPAFNASHNLRTASARKGERIQTADALKIPQPGRFDVGDKAAFIEKVTKAAEAGIFASFTQGFALISLVSNEEKWDVQLTECLRIWKAGCIIRAGGMTSFFEPIFKKHQNLPNPLVVPEIAQELSKNYAALKDVCSIAVAADAVAPTLQATLEYIKSFGNKQLPTNFTEMQLDAFGHHNYDLKADQNPNAVKGKYHTNFVPA